VSGPKKDLEHNLAAVFLGEGVVSFLGDPRKMPGNGSAVVALVSARAALNNRRSSLVVDPF